MIKLGKVGLRPGPARLACRSGLAQLCHIDKRAMVAAGFTVAAMTLAGCAGTSQPPRAASSHQADTAKPAGSLTPGPLSVPALIGKSTADRAVCWRFVRVPATKPAAERFMGWMNSGHGRQMASRSARVLIKDIQTWYHDSSGSSGDQARGRAGWVKASMACRSIGIFGPG